MQQIQQRAMQFFKDPDLVSAWMDSSFAGLGGKTPRQCATTPEGEERVLRYFKLFFEKNGQQDK